MTPPGASVGWAADGTASLGRWLVVGGVAAVLAVAAWAVMQRRAVRLPRG